MAHAGVKKGVGQGGGDGGHQAGPGFPEKGQGGFVRHGAVFNGVHAVFQGGPDAFRAFHMGGHLQSQGMGPVTGGFDQGRLHLENTGFSLPDRIQHAAGDHQFYEVRAGGSNLGYKVRGLLRGVGHMGKGTGHMATGNRNGHVACQNPGPNSLSGVDGIPEPGIKIQNAAHGPDGGYAGAQLLPGVARNQGHAQLFGPGIGGYQLDGLDGVGLLFLRFSASGKVNMEVDETRKQILPLQIDFREPFGDGGVGHHTANLPVFHQYGQPLLGGHIPGAVQQIAVIKREF